jgi:hypothetical protein
MAMLHFTRIFSEFTVVAALISLALTAALVVRDQVRQTTTLSDRLRVALLGSASLVMAGLAITLFTPLAADASVVTATTGLQAGLLLLVLAAAVLSMVEAAQHERRLRERLASYEQALAALQQREAARSEQVAEEYKRQAQQLQQGLLPAREGEAREFWLVPERGGEAWTGPLRLNAATHGVRRADAWPHAAR